MDERRQDVGSVRTALLAWYDHHARDLPWRVSPSARAAGVRPDPYRVWLSEIMLQQTTVATVGPYFERFVHRFPDVSAMAKAPLEDVLKLWAGLGYYARARNLHACAQAVLERFGGQFPNTELELRSLPGIGAYTSAAIATIAFDQPANVVDGNVERVMARLFQVEEPLPQAKPTLTAQAARLVADHRPGDWAQALMDLGATVCVPRAPRCSLCPIQDGCAAQKAGVADQLPRKAAKAARPTRYGASFLLLDDDRLWLRRREAKGLLGGMTEVPGTPWHDTPWTEQDTAEHAPGAGSWTHVGEIRHVFSHFALELSVWQSKGRPIDPAGLFAVPRAELEAAALPSVMRKVVALLR